MKTLLQNMICFTLVVITYLSYQNASAQATCGAGYTKAAVNFDMQYFSPSAMPTSPVTYMFGKNSMRFSWTGGANNVFSGVTAAHTGSTGGLGTGDDLKFMVSTGADTLVFDQEVTNVQFSVYDIDIRQMVTVTARNAAGTAQNITVTRPGTVLTLAGSGTTSASASVTTTTNQLNTSNQGTANFVIAGPVKTVVLTFTKTSGVVIDSIYISDISACNNNTTSGTWATNYQSISTPETGQPSFVLASYNDSIMVVDITNNVATLLYRDLSLSATGINSIAVDPYNQVIYYSDNARSATNKSIYKYDVKTGVETTWISDVTTLGIQLFSLGMGSGGASFYDGDLFIGVDQGAVSEPIAVYRIDIDASGNPTGASRYFSKIGRLGSNSYYDWADFVINDGVFYNFNFGAQAVARTTIMHFNLNIMDTIVGYTGTPRSQLAMDYSGNIYHMTTGGRELYNGAGGYGSVIPYTGTPGSAILDAGESFKYPYDYGDAPASYGRAFHIFKLTPDLMLGSEVDYQVKDTSNTTASADDIYNTGSSNDEDGIAAFPTLTTAYASYSVTVDVTNTTGANATLYGYIDFNGDGDFSDANEISAATTVPNGATTATVTWTGLSGLVAGSTYARFRIATLPAEAGSWFGYGATGEVEDYPITIEGSSLPVELVTFNGKEQEDKSILLTWRTAAEWNNDYFDVLHSENGTQWESIGHVKGNGNTHWITDYSFTDEHPYEGITYYMLKQVDFDKEYQNSPIISVRTSGSPAQVKETQYTLFPNPATNDLWIRNDGEGNNDASMGVEVFTVTGEMVFASTMQDNLQKVDMTTYQNGMYFVKVGAKIYKVIKE